MVRRNNDYSFWTAFAQWSIVGLAVIVIAFNTGVTYNHLHDLTGKVEKMTVKFEKLAEDVAGINVSLESIKLAIGLDKIQK